MRFSLFYFLDKICRYVNAGKRGKVGKRITKLVTGRQTQNTFNKLFRLRFYLHAIYIEVPKTPLC